MKRLLCLLLLALLLSGCSAAALPDASRPDPDPDTADGADGLSFRLTQTVYDNTARTDDGTALLRCRCTLPRLTLARDDGQPLDDDDPAAQKKLAVCAAFNAEMDALLTQTKATEAELIPLAASDLDFRLQTAAENGENASPFQAYESELDISSSYQTSRLLSFCLIFYSNTGGAHPNTALRTWNFDLATGEFLTYDHFTDDEPAFRAALSGAIMRQIDSLGLQAYYYDDYATYVENLAYTSVYFTDEGITVLFDEYTIGPHAAGTPSFLISYPLIADLLGERGLALLELPQSAFLLADFLSARDLWCLFHGSSLPVDSAVSTVLDDTVYFRVSDPSLSSLDALRALLCTRFSSALADEWLASGPYREIDGTLFSSAVPAAPADDSAQLSLLLSGNGGEVIASFPDEGDAAERRFPFTLEDGRAVFTEFDGYWRFA